MKTLLSLLTLILFKQALIAQYQIYTDQANLSAQRVIQTREGGFLMAAMEFCYTPEVVAVEGCTYAMYVIKTNAQGDTSWTNRLTYFTQFGPKISLYENDDDGFTLMAMTNQSFVCEGRYVGVSGFKQIQIFNLSPKGNLINEVRIPDNCQLTLQDVIKVGNNQWAVMAYYERPLFSDDEPEGRLFIMDHQGETLTQLTFPNETFKGGKLIEGDSAEFMMMYVDEDGVLHLQGYDSQLNLLNESWNTEVPNSCLTQALIKTDAKLLSNGDIGFLCHELSAAEDNLQFFRFDDNFNLLSSPTHNLISPTNFIENSEGSLMIASTDGNELMGFNIQLNYFDLMGNFLSASVITQSENEMPEQLIRTSSGGFAMAGSVNCCNYGTSIGPSNSFLWIKNPEITTDFTAEEKISVAVFPNPADSYMMIQIEDRNLLANEYEVCLYSPTGILLSHQALSSELSPLSLRDLAPSMYMYTISRKSVLIKRGKLIKR